MEPHVYVLGPRVQDWFRLGSDNACDTSRGLKEATNAEWETKARELTDDRVTR